MTTTKQSEKGYTPRKIEDQRFEFALYINQTNIICQRFFSIHDYNENVINSLDMKDLMDTLVGMNNGEWGTMGVIPSFLKQKSVEYLWNSYNPYYAQQEETNKNIFDKLDDFQFEIKVDKKVVAKGGFTGNFFQPKVRYAVNIREIIPTIISEIKSVFSQENYSEIVA